MEIGDTVICVDDSNISPSYPKIKNGNKYIVNGIAKCKCGAECLDIGFPCELTSFPHKNCGHSINLNYYPYALRRFRKIEPLYRTIEVSSEIKKQELQLN